MRDGALRRAVKRVARLAFEIDLAVHRRLRRARGERPWTLGGECRRCAACCEAPTIAVGAVVWSLAPARLLFLWWQRHVNGFALVRADPDDRSLVFDCTHFDRATRACDSYGSRPGMCRDYPRLLLWQPNPELLPGCGYRAKPPNAESLKLALSRIALTDEQREKVQRGLRLDG